MVGAPIGTSTLDTGHFLPGGQGGSPRVCAHAPRRGDCRSTPVPCIGQNHGLKHQPTIQTMQDDSPYSQQGLLLGWEGASALHAMAVLQVFQAKLLQSLEGGTTSPESVNNLCAATDFALMATKRAVQAIGRTMGFMIVQQRHLWLECCVKAY